MDNTNTKSLSQAYNTYYILEVKQEDTIGIIRIYSYLP